MGGVVVQDQVHGKSFGQFAVDGAQELQELFVAVSRQALPDHYPVSTLSAANSVVVPLRL